MNKNGHAQSQMKRNFPSERAVGAVTKRIRPLKCVFEDGAVFIFRSDQ